MNLNKVYLMQFAYGAATAVEAEEKHFVTVAVLSSDWFNEELYEKAVRDWGNPICYRIFDVELDKVMPYELPYES
jgi:hypothetical protein